MKSKGILITLSIIFGLIVWFIDAAVDCLFFYEVSFWDSLILGIPNHEMFMRSLMMISLTAFGLTISGIIASREAARKEMLDSEARWHRIFENVPCGIGLITQDGVMQLCNRFMLNMIGYTKEDINRINLRDIYQNIEEYDSMLNQLQRDGSIHSYEAKLKRKDSALMDVDVSMHTHNLKGELVIIIILRDITETKLKGDRQYLATQVLEILNQYGNKQDVIQNILRKIKEITGFDAIGLRLQDGEDYPYYMINGFSTQFVEVERYLCARDSVGRLMRDSTGNPVLECMCGNVICGRTDPSLSFFTEGGSFWTNSTTELIASTTEEDRQARTRNRCNGEGYESVALIPLRSGSEIIGLLQLNDKQKYKFTPEMITFFEKIVESIAIALANRKYQDTIQKERDTTRKYLDIAGVMFVAIDSKEKVTLINKKGCEILGYPQEEIIGKNWFENFLPEKLSENVKSVFQKLMSGGIEPVEYYENPVLTKGGEVRIIAWHNTILIDEVGDIVGSLSSGEDITERRKAEEELERYRDHLEDLVKERTIKLELANRELESFSYSVSHDLRSPLRAISGFAEIISHRYWNDLNEEIRHYFTNIIQASFQMDRLITDLLRYSRLGRRSIAFRPVPLNGVFALVMGSLSDRLTDMGATISIPDDLPVVIGDKTLLIQVFSNLIDNALTYHAPDVIPNIIVDWRNNAKSIIVSVIDNGIGVPIEFHDKIFHIFQRLHSQNEYPGTGIGLAIVKKSLDLLGGQICIESAVGQGSSFIVELPLESLFT
ncbi:MAG: PAS domain S-box protein [Spirochaetota bacterium]|nr:PAS domain S-box protein [Spirochaetota bacterium]